MPNRERRIERTVLDQRFVPAYGDDRQRPREAKSWREQNSRLPYDRNHPVRISERLDTSIASQRSLLHVISSDRSAADVVPTILPYQTDPPTDENCDLVVP